MTNANRRLVVLLGLLVVALSAASLAFACSPGRQMSLGHDSGVAGSAVTVTGKDFASQPIVLRWDSPTGPVLANVSPRGGSQIGGANFSQTVTIPSDASPRVHLIVAVTDGPGGHFEESAAFEVAAPRAAAPASPGVGATPSPTGAAAPVKGAAGTVSGLERPVKAPRNVRSGRQGAAGNARQVPAATRGQSDAGAPASSPSETVKRAGQVVFAGSVAKGASSKGKSSPAKATRATPASTSGTKTSTKQPSLTSKASTAALEERPGSRLGIGLGLLALGIIVPLAGFVVADVRRRRAEAYPDQR